MNFANGSGSEWGRGVEAVVGLILEKIPTGAKYFLFATRFTFCT